MLATLPLHDLFSFCLALVFLRSIPLAIASFTPRPLLKLREISPPGLSTTIPCPFDLRSSDL